MSINQSDEIKNKGYKEVLRTESANIIDRVKKNAEASLAKTTNIHGEASLAKTAYQQAIKAYEMILIELSKMPEGIRKKIQQAQETYGPEGFDNIDLLNQKLGYIKDSIDRDVSFATIQLSTIILAQKNGANVSEMLESIKKSSDLIKSECEKLFGNIQTQ